jgi:membrane dipeptidase
LRQGHVGAQFWSVWVPSTDDIKKLGFARIQLEQIDIAHRVVERYPDDLQLALSVADIEEANRNGRIASLLGAEGGHGIENSLGAQRTYYRPRRALRTLTHFKTHDWSDSANGCAAARRPHALRPGSSGGDESPRHARSSVSCLRGDDE